MMRARLVIEGPRTARERDVLESGMLDVQVTSVVVDGNELSPRLIQAPGAVVAAGEAVDRSVGPLIRVHVTEVPTNETGGPSG